MTMCMSIAPAKVAMCVEPGENGIGATPWCHLDEGHDGPCKCGEFQWWVTASEWAAIKRERDAARAVVEAARTWVGAFMVSSHRHLPAEQTAAHATAEALAALDAGRGV